MIICRKGLCVHKIIKPRLFVALLVKTIWSFLNQMKNIDLIESFLHYINLNNLTKNFAEHKRKGFAKITRSFRLYFHLLEWHTITCMQRYASCHGTVAGGVCDLSQAWGKVFCRVIVAMYFLMRPFSCRCSRCSSVSSPSRSLYGFGRELYLVYSFVLRDITSGMQINIVMFFSAVSTFRYFLFR